LGAGLTVLSARGGAVPTSISGDWGLPGTVSSLVDLVLAICTSSTNELSSS
jgi:hypothetical protein